MPTSFLGPLFPAGPYPKQILGEAQVCSPQVQGCELAFVAPPCSWDPNLLHFVVTTAKIAFILHIPNEPLVAGGHEVLSLLVPLSLGGGSSKNSPGTSWFAYVPRGLVALVGHPHPCPFIPCSYLCAAVFPSESFIMALEHNRAVICAEASSLQETEGL